MDETWYSEKLNKYLSGRVLNVLVIIDDVWSKSFINLSIIMQSKAPNSRIVISTRNSKLLDGKDKEEICLDFLQKNERC